MVRNELFWRFGTRKARTKSENRNEAIGKNYFKWLTKYNKHVTITVQRETLERNIDMAMRERDKEISFVIERHLGVISKSQSGWTKELNLVSWNGTPAKFDIREWDPNHAHMSKGITLRRDELEPLARLLWGFLGEEERKAAAVAAVRNGGQAGLDPSMSAPPVRIEPETGEVLGWSEPQDCTGAEYNGGADMAGPEGTAADEAVAEAAEWDDAAPDRTASDRADLDGAMPDRTALNGDAPDRAVQDGTAPNDDELDQAALDDELDQAALDDAARLF